MSRPCPFPLDARVERPGKMSTRRQAEIFCHGLERLAAAMVGRRTARRRPCRKSFLSPRALPFWPRAHPRTKPIPATPLSPRATPRQVPCRTVSPAKARAARERMERPAPAGPCRPTTVRPLLQGLPLRDRRPRMDRGVRREQRPEPSWIRSGPPTAGAPAVAEVMLGGRSYAAPAHDNVQKYSGNDLE